MANPNGWNSTWGTYEPGKTDFTTKMWEYINAGDTTAAAAVEAARNSYVTSAAYTGSKGTTNIVSGIVSAAASSAESLADKVTGKTTTEEKAAADTSESSSKITYVTYDPSNYTSTLTTEEKDTKTANIIGYGVIAVIGLVILDKLIG